MKNHPEEAKKIYEKNYQNLKKWMEKHPEEYQQKVMVPFFEGSKKYWINHPKQQKRQS